MSHPPSLHVITGSTRQCVFGDHVENTTKSTTKLLAIHKHCEALLVRADGRDHRDQHKGTCIVMPHGGPNSNFVDEYHPLLQKLLSAGFSLCRVNYTGSTGYTAESLRSLIDGQQVGVADVSDCETVANVLKHHHHYATLYFYGGSHGGYLGAMLTSQYPALFQRAVLVNPVISMWANCVAADINDYVWHNLGLPYDYTAPTRDDLDLMYQRSPRVPRADAPPTRTLIMVGGKDERVPARCNGVAWWGWLRRAGWGVECLWFADGNHGLTGTAEMERDVRSAIVSFFSDTL